MHLLSFITDAHLLGCIKELHNVYVSCQKQMTLNKFYKNKVDPIKFHFDMLFNKVSFESYIDMEIVRQNDKTISNAIGYFHQNIIGGIDGFIDMGIGGGCDIKKADDTIFAEIKNKHNTMNSSSAEATYQKLQYYANQNIGATCYLVEIIAKRSQDTPWVATLNGKVYNHPRVRRISADKFYSIATGHDNAFYELCTAIPNAAKIYMENIGLEGNREIRENSIYSEIAKAANNNDKTLLLQIMHDNFSGYKGF